LCRNDGTKLCVFGLQKLVLCLVQFCTPTTKAMGDQGGTVQVQQRNVKTACIGQPFE
jgi:hypothetical protein